MYRKEYLPKKNAGIKKLIFLYFLLFFGLYTVTAHPVHVSVTNMEIEEDNLTLAVKVFKDDLQLAIYHSFGSEPGLDELDSETFREDIDKYMNSRFTLLLNRGIPVTLTFEDTETNEEAIWINYRAKITKAKKIKISNQVFTDIYPDQTNLLIVYSGGKQNGYRFTGKNYETIIDVK